MVMNPRAKSWKGKVVKKQGGVDASSLSHYSFAGLSSAALPQRI
jgi:hypothetical protein